MNNQINPEYQERLIEDEEEEKDLNSGKLLCDNCIGDLIDMVFFGPMIRPLFDLKNFKDAEEAGEKIKTGLLEFVAASGVVSALLVGIAIGQAFGSEATDFLTSLNMFMWYLSSMFSMWSVIISTMAGVLLSVTPESNILVMGQKMLYIWVIPAWLMLWAWFCLFLGIWTQAEVNYSKTMIKNNQTEVLFQNEGAVIWFTRGFAAWTLLCCGIGMLIIMCAPDFMQKYMGIQTSHAKGTTDRIEKVKKKLRGVSGGASKNSGYQNI